MPLPTHFIPSDVHLLLKDAQAHYANSRLPFPDYSLRIATSLRGAAQAKRRVFVDLDGVVVDFEGYKQSEGLTGDEVKCQPGAYLAMKPYPGAIDAVLSLIGMGFDVWIATKPPTGIAFAYSDKAAWVMKHIPELKRKIIITHHKGMLGNSGDFLIDDRPHKAGCEEFKGTLIPFLDGMDWAGVLNIIRDANKARHSSGEEIARCAALA